MKWTATTATAASGGCRKLLLGPRPAGCECNCTKQTLGAATRTHLRGESPLACCLLYTFEEPHKACAARFVQLVDTGIGQYLGKDMADLILHDAVHVFGV